jgi:hypothetical protein
MKRIVIPIATLEGNNWILNIKFIDEIYCYAMARGFSLGMAEFDPTLSKENREKELAKVFEGMKQMVLKVNNEPLNQGIPKLEISYSKFIETHESVVTKTEEIKQWIKVNEAVTVK